MFSFKLMISLKKDFDKEIFKLTDYVPFQCLNKLLETIKRY